MALRIVSQTDSGCELNEIQILADQASHLAQMIKDSSIENARGFLRDSQGDSVWSLAADSHLQAAETLLSLVADLTGQIAKRAEALQ